MANKTQHRTTSKTGTSTLEFADYELNSTMQEFLKEEENVSGKGIWNIATISGMVMLFLAITFLIQSIGLPTGAFLSELSDSLIGTSLLPLIGGGLITLVGFGFFVGDRKRAKKEKKRRRAAQRTVEINDIPGGEDEDVFTGTNAGLSNDLDSDFNTRSSSADAFAYDNYGYRHARKLMKSRTDKKWAGVCGGLAKYFGISSTVVRFAFTFAFFMSWGVSLLVYMGLSLAMPKEPVEMMDDFDF